MFDAYGITFLKLLLLLKQIDISPSMAYYNNNRTPHTSHASDVSHGETFFLYGKG